MSLHVSFALADKLGLERQAMFDVASTSSGYSWSLNAYPAQVLDQNHRQIMEIGFSTDLMLKDLRLSQKAAEAADADTPMGAAATIYIELLWKMRMKRFGFLRNVARFEKRGREV